VRVKVSNSLYSFYPERVKNVSKRSENSWQCSCPCSWAHAHGDANPSLSLRVEGETLLAKCFRNCAFDDIIREFKRQGVLVPASQVNGHNPPSRPAVPPPPLRAEKEVVAKADLARYDAKRVVTHARVYWQAQFNVLPCNFGAKSPRGCWKQYQRERYDGKKLAQAIKQPCNLAVVCGEPWNLLVLDIDNPTLFAERVLRPATLSLKSFLRLCERSGAHIERSGKGFHLFFAHSQLPSTLLDRKATLDAAGFEVLSKESETCVVAPSYHSGKKKFYRAVTPLSNLKERKPIPQQVVELLTSAIERFSATRDEEWHYPIPFALEEALPPCPADILPSLIRELAGEIARAVQVPLEMPVGFALATIAASAMGGWQIEVKRDFVVETNFYALVVARSGERKSEAYRKIINPLREWERVYQKREAAEVAAANDVYDLYEQKRNALKNAIVKSQDPKQEQELMQKLRELHQAPPAKRYPFKLIVANATSEALEKHLAEQNGLAAILSDEPDVLGVIAAGKYNTQNSIVTNTLGVLLNGFDGGAVETIRIGRANVFVERALLSIGLAVQPVVLRALMDNQNLTLRGLPARFAFFWCSSRAGTRELLGEEVNEQLLSRWRELLFELLNKRIHNFKLGKPQRLTFEPAAFRRLVAFHDNESEPRFREGGEFERAPEWGNRWVALVVRLAALFHLAQREESNTISLETLERAIVFGYYLKSHALFALAQSGVDETYDNAAKVASKVTALALREFTLRDVERWCHCTAEEGEAVLNFLTQRGWIKPAQAMPKGTGRPRTVCVVNPAVHDPETLKTCDKSDRSPIHPPRDGLLSLLSQESNISSPKLTEVDHPKETTEVKTADSANAVTIVKQYETNSATAEPEPPDEDDPPPSPPSGLTPEESAKLDHLACVLKKTIEERGELRITPNTTGYAQVAYYLQDLKSRVLPEFTLIQEQDGIVAKRALREDDIEFIARAKEMWSTPQLLADVLKTDARAVKAVICKLKREAKPHG
jgi:replicative DNA helicase